MDRLKVLLVDTHLGARTTANYLNRVMLVA